MKIDIFCHITPPKFLEALKKKISPQVFDRLPSKFLPTLSDLDIRFRILDSYEGMEQVLSLANPPIELIAEPAVAAELSQIVNDEMAELVAKYPDRFLGAVACLPMNDPEAALREVDRAIKDLHLKGIQIFSSVAGKPLDAAEFMPLYEKMAQYDLPIWIHPIIESVPGADPAEAMDHIAFQIAYRSTTAMTRLVYSHVFDKYPKIKLITHHCGSTIPYFANRVLVSYDMVKMRKEADHGFRKPILDYYKMFYADTALHGNVPAMTCGYHFFGADHILFGTDMPFDAELGAWSVRKTVDSIERIELTDAERKKIFEDNARVLLRLAI
jgi:predicted TIM-barrel fold metal-dependent hydrolase